MDHGPPYLDILLALRILEVYYSISSQTLRFLARAKKKFLISNDYSIDSDTELPIVRGRKIIAFRELIFSDKNILSAVIFLLVLRETVPTREPSAATTGAVRERAG